MKKYLPILCLLLPSSLSILIYLNCLQHSFVYDDESTVTYNYFIRDWSNLPKLFTAQYFARSAELTYRPVVTLSYFIDYTIWHLDPLGYHLTNILLHAANSTLFFVFTLQVLKKRTTALISALFFSSYPLFSEAVNAVGFREDLLAFLFFLLAFILYLKNDAKNMTESGQRGYVFYYVLSLLSYGFGLFSKEMAITLPLLIILYDFIFQGLSLKKTFSPSPLPLPSREGRTVISSVQEGTNCHSVRFPSPGGRGLRGGGSASFFAFGRSVRFSCPRSKNLPYYLGYLFVTLFYIIIRFVVLYNPQESRIPYPHEGLFARFSTLISMLAYYVKMLFIPVPLNADYVVPLSLSPITIPFWLSLLLLTAIGSIALRFRYRQKHVYFFILWFFVTLIPVMNIIPLGNIMAERYLYLPGAGFCAAIACLVSNGLIPQCSSEKTTIIHPPLANEKSEKFPPCPGSSSQKILIAFIFIFVFILTGNAYLTLSRNRDWKDGLQLWSKTARISPNSLRAHINLGNAYLKEGFNAAALAEYKTAWSINPVDADVYNNLGVYYNTIGLLDEAIQNYQKCLTIRPTDAKAHNNVGVILTRQKKFDDAIQAFQQALSINPFYPDAHNNLGIAYYRKGSLDEAKREFTSAIRLEPNHAGAHNDLGILYNDLDRGDDAIREFETAIRIKPHYANAHLNLGAVIFKQKKDKEKALFHLEESLKLDPQQEQAAGIQGLIRQMKKAD